MDSRFKYEHCNKSGKNNFLPVVAENYNMSYVGDLIGMRFETPDRFRPIHRLCYLDMYVNGTC